MSRHDAELPAAAQSRSGTRADPSVGDRLTLTGVARDQAGDGVDRRQKGGDVGDRRQRGGASMGRRRVGAAHRLQDGEVGSSPGWWRRGSPDPAVWRPWMWALKAGIDGSHRIRRVAAPVHGRHQCVVVGRDSGREGEEAGRSGVGWLWDAWSGHWGLGVVALGRGHRGELDGDLSGKNMGSVGVGCVGVAG